MVGPKFSCLMVEENPREKPQPGKLTRPGIETGQLGERQRYYALTTAVVTKRGERGPAFPLSKFSLIAMTQEMGCNELD